MHVRQALVVPVTPPGRRALAECQSGEVEELQQLLAEGLNPSAANGVGQTGLHVACLWGRHKVVDLLIKAGAKVGTP